MGDEVILNAASFKLFGYLNLASLHVIS